MIILFSQAYERYALPIVPALCLGLAYLFDHVGRSVAETRLRRSLWALLLTACLVPTAVKSVYLVYLTAQPDTRAEALSWIEREIPQGETMVMQHIFFSPRVSQTPEQIREKSAWVGADDPHREQKLKKIEWLAGEAALRRGYRVSYLNESGWKAPVFTQASPLVEPDLSQWKRQGIRYFIRYRHPGESAFFDKTLSPYAELVAVFSPYREPKKVMTVDVWAHVGLPFVSEELFSRDQPGPYLEIHRIIDR